MVPIWCWFIHDADRLYCLCIAAGVGFPMTPEQMSPDFVLPIGKAQIRREGMATLFAWRICRLHLILASSWLAY